MSQCLDCHSFDTELVQGDDGYHRKRCHGCGYVGGPYTSDASGRGGVADPEPAGQSTLGKW